MCIAWGQTRFVVLTGECAIKFARLRAFRFLFRLPLLIVSKKRRRHFFEKYGNSFLVAMKNDIFAGVIANRKEYEYSASCVDSRVMPIRVKLIWGWIVIQERGLPVSLSEIAKESPLKCPFSIRGKSHLSDPHQFCRNSVGKIVLVDYGNEETQMFLRNTM